MRFPVDFDAYTTQEITFLVDFLHRVDRVGHGTMKSDGLLEDYKRFQAILNSKAEEKRIDKAFAQQTGVSIYKTMQTLKQ